MKKFLLALVILSFSITAQAQPTTLTQPVNTSTSGNTVNLGGLINNTVNGLSLIHI